MGHERYPSGNVNKLPWTAVMPKQTIVMKIKEQFPLYKHLPKTLTKWLSSRKIISRQLLTLAVTNFLLYIWRKILSHIWTNPNGFYIPCRPPFWTSLGSIFSILQHRSTWRGALCRNWEKLTLDNATYDCQKSSGVGLTREISVVRRIKWHNFHETKGKI